MWRTSHIIPRTILLVPTLNKAFKEGWRGRVGAGTPGNEEREGDNNKLSRSSDDDEVWSRFSESPSLILFRILKASTLNGE
jgi:hypothetical protein